MASKKKTSVPVVDPKLGYTPHKALYKNDQQLANDIRNTIHKLADQMNTAREKGIEVSFNIGFAGEYFVPVISIKKAEEL